MHIIEKKKKKKMILKKRDFRGQNPLKLARNIQSIIAFIYSKCTHNVKYDCQLQGQILCTL